ncbi:hypothetical protein ACGE24_09300 [Corynebacterium kroppenstedtii]|uniref:hypothetical protein n=1 Tax=Corynebacterium sp. PCR 32 TaxID=3351342 RepID=UPI0030AF6865
MTHRCGKRSRGGESGEPGSSASAGGYAHDGCCHDIIDELNDLLDQPCDAQRRQALMDLVKNCPEHGEAYGIEQEVRSLLRRSCSEAASHELRTRIHIAITEHIRYM